MELEQLLKKRMRLETDNTILHNKLHILFKQNLNVEKQQQSLADEVNQLRSFADGKAMEPFSSKDPLNLKESFPVRHPLSSKVNQLG